MRQLRELLRLRYEANLSIRQIRASTKVSVGKIQSVLKRFEESDLSWPLPENLDDQALANRFYPQSDVRLSHKKVEPDWSEVHQQLKGKTITRQLLWEEYTEQYPNRCYSYSQFCDRYDRWRKKLKRSLRQVHKAGEKLFIDYCGPTLPVVNRYTGEIKQAQVFVAVLGASNYTYCEATWSQSLPDWLNSHVRAFEFLGGLPEVVIPDNLRSGVSKACRYDPKLNPAYQQLAAHYQVAIIPARPYKPKDKAKAEVGVQIVERWIMAGLRHHTFFSLGEVNQAIKVLLVELNQKPFKNLPGSRLSAFEQLDKPALKPLPKHPYEYRDVKDAKVYIDYHVEYEQHFYSVPHHLVGEEVVLQASDRLVEIYFKNQLIASHVRKFQTGMTTVPSHMPEKHEKHMRWTPGRFMNWASDTGPQVLEWVKQRFVEKDHPEQAYRVCLGVLNLARKYSNDRLNNACYLANLNHLNRYHHIKDILKYHRDQLVEQQALNMETTWEETLPQQHENIRGAKAFH